MVFKFFKNGLSIIIMVFGLLSPAAADITLRTNGINIVLSPLFSWTVVQLSWNGYPVIEKTGSGQGTVILVDAEPDIWAGSVHANEIVLETNLLIDGTPIPVIDGTEYPIGRGVTFSRRTLLFHTYLLTSTMNISENTITESIYLQGIDPNKTIKIFYGFLGSRSNSLTTFYGYDLNGSVRVSGVSSLDNGAVYGLSNAASVCQYGPQTGLGVLSTIINGNVYGLDAFIWDRSIDNKLYARFRSLETDCKWERYYVIQQRLDFFVSSPESVNQKVHDILAVISCTSRPEGDISGDCEVNMLDFALLAANWQECRRSDCY